MTGPKGSRLGRLKNWPFVTVRHVAGRNACLHGAGARHAVASAGRAEDRGERRAQRRVAEDEAVLAAPCRGRRAARRAAVLRPVAGRQPQWRGRQAQERRAMQARAQARARTSRCAPARARSRSPRRCSDGVAIACAISRTRSSRSIHDIHCLPEPIGPPRPYSNGDQQVAPACRPRCRARGRCAAAPRARRSAPPARPRAPSRRRPERVKHGRPSAASVSVSSPLRAVPADRRGIDQHGGLALQPLDQAHDVAGHAQARGEDAVALADGPQSVRDRLAREIDDRVDRACRREAATGR